MTPDSSNVNMADGSLVTGALPDRSQHLADRGLFLLKFLRKGRAISSAVPSSHAMAASVLRHVDFDRPSTIVELGAGTGPVTEQIVERLRPHHRFVAVEIDRDFCEVLRRRFPEVTLLQTDATRVAEPLGRLGIEKVDYVISGLPTARLPQRSQVHMWRWLARSLKPDGAFIQITVAPLLYRPFYDRLFEDVRYRMVWWNVPPGGVYRCTRPRARLRRKPHNGEAARR